MSSEKTTTQTNSNPTLYANYAGGRLPYPAMGYQLATGLNLNANSPLSNMTNLKASLPGVNSNATEVNGMARSGYGGTAPVVVLSSGQTVPLAATIYGHPQSASSEEANPMPYIPTGALPNFVVGNNVTSTAMAPYNWPYGLAGIDPARRTSWSSTDEGVPIAAPVGQSEYYPTIPFIPNMPSGITNQYIPGPIQAMKTKDNKGYEMINLDELVSRDPPIPRAVPALWTNQDDLSLAKCLQNPEGITNIYIRGFMPDTTDKDLELWAGRFGEIESCKAIIDQDTGKCKGFGFVMYYSPASAENCIRGFYHLGFQASYAQKSRNSRLKDLEDKTSTNIYCTGVPINWNEADLAKHFLPYRAVSTKICRDVPSGVSKEVGFARFETREIAERVIKDFHSTLIEHDGVKLYLRFADTRAQKQLKQQSQERRAWRSREYSYSVEHTPSPTMTRLQNLNTQVSPASAVTYVSPAGISNERTPSTSVSPPDMAGVSINKLSNGVRTSSTAWPMQGGLTSITNTSTVRNQIPVSASRTTTEVPPQIVTAVPAMPDLCDGAIKQRTPSPEKVSVKAEAISGKENVIVTPRSSK